MYRGTQRQVEDVISNRSLMNGFPFIVDREVGLQRTDEPGGALHVDVAVNGTGLPCLVSREMGSRNKSVAHQSRPDHSGPWRVAGGENSSMATVPRQGARQLGARHVRVARWQ